jgi:ubiquinone/menaquinone biosynthesis C-methylase UbiE
MSHDHDRRFEPAKLAKLDSDERRERTPPEAIRAAASPFGGKRVADVGAGAGFFTFALLDATEPPAEIYAVDVSPELLAVLENRVGAHPQGSRVRVRQAPGESLPLEQAAVDLVTLGMVLHELDDALGTLREAHRVLDRGGRVLIVDWEVPADTSGEPEGGPPYGHRVPSSTARALLEQAGFKDIGTCEGFRDLYALTATR